MSNEMITIVGPKMGAVSANMVESILSIKLEEAQIVLKEALEDGRYCPLIGDKSKIKSLVILSNGQVYPSNFRYDTLKGRFSEEDNND